MKTVYIASSSKYYDQVKEIKKELDAKGVKGFYPYFEFHTTEADDDEELKKKLTLDHFPELDQIDVLYIVAQDGYVGCSVTIETAYSYAKNKEIISSEPVGELAVRAMVSKTMTPAEFVAYASS